ISSGRWTVVNSTNFASPVSLAAAVAVSRGAAHRRSDASARDSCDRLVRRRAAQPERRAAPAGRAMEVRLQEHQIDREDSVHRQAAENELAARRARVLRVLLERE